MRRVKRITSILERHVSQELPAKKETQTYSLLRELFAYSKNRVLVVDDEEFCLSTMKALFKQLNFDFEKQCDFCIDGKEAIDQVKNAYQIGMSYKLILTDFSMPVVDGIESSK